MNKIVICNGAINMNWWEFLDDEEWDNQKPIWLSTEEAVSIVNWWDLLEELQWEYQQSIWYVIQ